MPPASDCVLLVTIPLNERDFRDDARRPSDFVESYAHRLGVPPVDAWRSYERYARHCRAVIERVKEKDVVVILRATLGDLVRAIGRYAVVTLVAHSRGPEITSRDLVDASAVTAASSTLRREINAAAPSLASGAGRDAVVTWLNALIGPADGPEDSAMSPSRESAWRAHLYRTRWLRRQAVERLCPGALKGGPAVEFHDGLHRIEQIDAALPAHLPGTLDMTICDSVLLADTLRARRASGVILANAQPTTPDLRLSLYRETIGLMVRRRLSYVEAALTIRRALRAKLWQL